MDNAIIVQGGIIVVMGTVYSIQNNRPLTPVFVGAIGVLLIVSLLDVYGGVWSTIGRALLALATFSVLVAEGGNLLSGLQNALKK